MTHGLLTALGVDWRALILNALAFLVIVYILGTWVYPLLTKALDNKAHQLDEAARLEQEAKDRLIEAEHKVAAQLREARQTADEMLALAREEAAATAKTATEQAETAATRLVDEARRQLARDTEHARRSLAAETARLVASAAGTVLEQRLDDTSDQELIERSLQQWR